MINQKDETRFLEQLPVTYEGSCVEEANMVKAYLLAGICAHW
jgi:hypothetical protein